MMNKTLIFSLLLLLAPGCQGERTETSTKGHVNILVAESVQPLIKAEEEKFEGVYPEAKIDLEFVTSREAIARLFNDSVTMIVSSRALNSEEHEVQKRFKIEMLELKIAVDGIAVIVNVQNPLTQISMAMLDSLLSGKAKFWNQGGWSAADKSVHLYLPGRNSSTYEVTVDRVLHGSSFGSPVKVIELSAEMIHAVMKDPYGIGLVGLNWYNQEKERVKALDLLDPSLPDSLGASGKYFGPYQAFIYQGVYPITRDVYIYSRADSYGVAAGFTSFITSGAGQKIVVSNGLVPATMPVRIVEMTNRSLK